MPIADPREWKPLTVWSDRERMPPRPLQRRSCFPTLRKGGAGIPCAVAAGLAHVSSPAASRKPELKVMNELKTRGVNDVLIAVVDGLKGFPEAIGTVFPLTTVQTCIIHLIRNSLAFVSWKDRKLIMPDLKAIYRAETAEAAAAELDAFEAEWGKRYPAIGQAWRRAWQHVVPLFAFPPAIRKMIYTTNAVESLNRSLRKIIKTRGSFPTDEAALKLLFLAIRNAGLHWRRPIEWTAAVGQFAILFGDRFEPSAR
jgi:putative transposase